MGSIPGRGKIFFLHRVQTGSGAHPASYGIGGRESSRGVKLTLHLHLVPRSILVEIYRRSPILLHGAVLN
jgi:hypothetical protein